MISRKTELFKFKRCELQKLQHGLGLFYNGFRGVIGLMSVRVGRGIMSGGGVVFVVVHHFLYVDGRFLGAVEETVFWFLGAPDVTMELFVLGCEFE